MKPCPFCGEAIQTTAAKCRYCSEWLDPGKRPPWSERQNYSDSTPDPRTYVLPPTKHLDHPVHQEASYQTLKSDRKELIGHSDRNVHNDHTDQIDRQILQDRSPDSGYANGNSIPESPRRTRKNTERFVPLGAKQGETHLRLPVHLDPRLHSTLNPPDEKPTNFPAPDQKYGRQDWVARRREQTQPFDTRQTRAIASGVWVSAPKPAMSDKASPPPSKTAQDSANPANEVRYVPSSEGPVLLPKASIQDNLSTSPENSAQDLDSDAQNNAINQKEPRQRSFNHSRRRLPEFSSRIKPPTSAFARLSSTQSKQRTWFIWGFATIATGLLIYAVFRIKQSADPSPSSTSKIVTSDSHFPPNRIKGETPLIRSKSEHADSQSFPELHDEGVRSAGFFDAKSLINSSPPNDIVQNSSSNTTTTTKNQPAASKLTAKPTTRAKAPSLSTRPKLSKIIARRKSTPKDQKVERLPSTPGNQLSIIPVGPHSRIIPASTPTTKNIDLQIAAARKSILDGQPKRALAILDRLPESPRTCEIRAEIESELGHLKKAISIAQRCVSLNQSYDPCWAIIAALAEKNHDVKHTIEAWRRYLAISPRGKYSELARRTIRRMSKKQNTSRTKP